jgi:hypothetical protein
MVFSIPYPAAVVDDFLYYLDHDYDSLPFTKISLSMKDYPSTKEYMKALEENLFTRNVALIADYMLLEKPDPVQFLENMAHLYGADDEYIVDYIESNDLEITWRNIAVALMRKYPLLD